MSENGALQLYQQWLPQQWFPKAQILDSRQTRTLLSKISDETSKQYFKLRFEKVKRFYEELQKKNSFNTKVKHLLALDSTCIHSYSETIEDVAFGHAKQRPDLKQINYTLGVDYLTGQTIYALECEGSITDKPLYPTVIADMINSDMDLTDTVFVSDRSYNSLYNVQNLINSRFSYMTGVPLSEGSIKDKFIKYKDSCMSSAFYLPEVDLYCRSFKESWQQRCPQTGQQFETKQSLHLYMNPELQMLQMRQLEKIINEVVEKKNARKVVEHSLYVQAKLYLREDKKTGKWYKDVTKLDQVKCLKGAWAIRTNCIEDPIAAVRISRQRNVIEEAFRGFKVEMSSDRLRCTQTCYQGKLFLLSIA